MGVVERSRRYYSVPLEVPFLSGGQLSAARGGLRLIQAPRLLVDFAKSSGARSDLAVLARAGVASIEPGRAVRGAGLLGGRWLASHSFRVLRAVLCWRLVGLAAQALGRESQAARLG